jgi:hypothetical protein
MACSSPGPMFDIASREMVDVIWVNRLDHNILPDVRGTCLDTKGKIKDKDYCKIMAKINRTQTYLDPTDMNELHSSATLMPITPNSWPMTTHLHGAEIRPTFDGNPLSWIDNRQYEDGQVGVATFSLDD